MARGLHAEAAEALGLDATTLPKLMRELGVERAGRAQAAFGRVLEP